MPSSVSFAGWAFLQFRFTFVGKGEYWAGKRTSCLVTFRTWDEANWAVDELHGLEAEELADVPLEVEIATGCHNRGPAQQAPIRA